MKAIPFPIDPALSGMALVERWIGHGYAAGFNDRLRARPIRASHGTATFECILDADHGNLVGILHGGVSAAMADMAAGAAVMTLIQPGETLVTVDLHLHYIKPGAVSGTIEADALVATATPKRAVAHVSVRIGSDVIALGSASFAIRPAVR